MQLRGRAVPISLLADYANNAYSRLLKQPIPIMRPIILRELPFFTQKVFLSMKISYDLFSN